MPRNVKIRHLYSVFQHTDPKHSNRARKGTTKTDKMAIKARKDEEVLAGLGYKQEFKRAFTPLEVFGIGFSIIGLLPSIA